MLIKVTLLVKCSERKNPHRCILRNDEDFLRSSATPQYVPIVGTNARIHRCVLLRLSLPNTICNLRTRIFLQIFYDEENIFYNVEF